VLKNIAQMAIPLYQMISMLVICFVLKINVLKMEHVFHTGYWEGEKVFYVSPLNWKGHEFLKHHVFLELALDVWEWKIWVFFVYNLDFKSFFKCMFFLFRMVITSCKLGCLTLIVYMMMSPHGTSWLIPLSLTPFMGLFSSSLPWQNTTSMFLNLLFFPYIKLDLKDFVIIPLYISAGQWN